MLSIHPFLRIAASVGMHALSDRPDLDADQAETLARFESNERGSLHALADQMASHRHTMPNDGRIALAHAGTFSGSHPFINWLVSPQGLAWLVALAQYIAAILGWKLPPLPPLPTP